MHDQANTVCTVLKLTFQGMSPDVIELMLCRSILGMGACLARSTPILYIDMWMFLRVSEVVKEGIVDQVSDRVKL